MPSPRDELANALTHGAGFVASVIGVPLLLMAVIGRGDGWQLAGCAVFGATLVLLYAASTVYHACPPSRAKQVLQVVDHVAIYLLIAGTYTPFALGVIRGTWGWFLFGTIWTLAAVGIVYKTVLGVRFPRLSIALYLTMGWFGLAAIPSLAAALPGAALAWIVAGGLLYTGGVAFYVRSHPGYHHTIWHLFVLGGSACHYLAVFWYATARQGAGPL